MRLFFLVAADAVAIILGNLLARSISASWCLPTQSLIVYVVLVTLFGFTEGLYSTAVKRSLMVTTAIEAKCAVLALGIVYLGSHNSAPWPAFVVGLMVSLVGLSGWSWLRAYTGKHSNDEHVSRNILIVGAGPSGRRIARALRENCLSHAAVRGFLDDQQPLSPDVLGRIDDLPWLARAEFIDEVIVALPNQFTRAQEAAILARRNHLDVRMLIDLPPGDWPTAGTERLAEMPIVALHREHLPEATLFLKRCLDVAGAIVGLLLSAPVMAVIAVLIRCDSCGQVIYAAERAGIKGRRFTCLKFRTMIDGADQYRETLRSRNQREGPNFKLNDDPRITRVGQLLRRYSLDELPQLWNVLRGEMSLVGPRPHPMDEVNRYELHHYRRLDVKPGLTGLWQITARKDPSFALNMHLDLTYIENWNLMLDLKILMRTLRVLFVPEGA